MTRVEREEFIKAAQPSSGRSGVMTGADASSWMAAQAGGG